VWKTLLKSCFLFSKEPFSVLEQYREFVIHCDLLWQNTTLTEIIIKEGTISYDVMVSDSYWTYIIKLKTIFL